MPKLNPLKNKKNTLKISISQSLSDEIEAYVTHYGLVDSNDFIEQACEHILRSDSDWKKTKKQLEKAKTNTNE